MKFSDLGLSDDILQAVTDAGYETPTPIQAKAIPYVLMNRDVLGCAQTGTGKTHTMEGDFAQADGQVGGGKEHAQPQRGFARRSRS